jgi:formate dehydrogenase major subunit
VEFLRNIGLNKRVDLTGKVVAVIGGGNSAIDAARTSLRLGAKEVLIIYRRSRAEMPANDIEIKEAEYEGVKYHFLAAPVRIIPDEDKVAGIECIKMELGEPDETGRRKPVPVKGSEFVIDVQIVIAAIGQMPDVRCLIDEKGIEKTRKNTLVVDEQTGMLKGKKGVFAAGDVVLGAATVVEAIAGAKKVARAIDMYLQGNNNSSIEIGYDKMFNVSKGSLDEIDKAEFEGIEKQMRVKMPELVLECRLKGFDEVEQGLKEMDAVKETDRCLKCGCKAIDKCYLRRYGMEYGVVLNKFKGGMVHKYQIDTSNPKIERDPNKCIRCGKCVRICLEIKGIGALGFVRRGFDTVIEPTFGLPLAETECDSCGKCVEACPTGGLWSDELCTESGITLKSASR